MLLYLTAFLLLIFPVVFLSLLLTLLFFPFLFTQAMNTRIILITILPHLCQISKLDSVVRCVAFVSLRRCIWATVSPMIEIIYINCIFVSSSTLLSAETPNTIIHDPFSLPTLILTSATLRRTITNQLHTFLSLLYQHLTENFLSFHIYNLHLTNKVYISMAPLWPTGLIQTTSYSG